MLPNQGYDLNFSVNVLVNNPLRQRLPRCFFMDVVNKWCLCRARHIINNDVRFRREALEKIGEIVQCGNLPGIFDANG